MHRGLLAHACVFVVAVGAVSDVAGLWRIIGEYKGKRPIEPLAITALCAGVLARILSLSCPVQRRVCLR